VTERLFLPAVVALVAGMNAALHDECPLRNTDCV